MSDRHYGGQGSANARNEGGYRQGQVRDANYGVPGRHGASQATSRGELGDQEGHTYDYERRIDGKSRRGAESGQEYPNKRVMSNAASGSAASVYNPSSYAYEVPAHGFVHNSSTPQTYGGSNAHFSGSSSNINASRPWSSASSPSTAYYAAPTLPYTYYMGHGGASAATTGTNAKSTQNDYYDPLAPPIEVVSVAEKRTPLTSTSTKGASAVGSTTKAAGTNSSVLATQSSTSSSTRSSVHGTTSEKESTRGTPLNKAPGALVFSFDKTRSSVPPKSTLFQSTSSKLSSPSSTPPPQSVLAPKPSSPRAGTEKDKSPSVVVSNGATARATVSKLSESAASSQSKDGVQASGGVTSEPRKDVPERRVEASVRVPLKQSELNALHNKAGPPRYGTRTLETYKVGQEISQGAYGVVYKAVDLYTNEIVALKRVKVDPLKEKEAGFPLSSVREIRALGFLQHEHIVRFRDLIPDESGATLYLVLDYVEHDLHQLLKRHKGTEPLFSIPNVKSLVYQLLTSIEFLHSKNFMHRDIKSSNLLLSQEGKLFLADFGLAKEWLENGLRTPTVVTISYRAPELVFEAPDYSLAIDMWSVGLIMAELLNGREFIRGVKTQLELIGKLCEIFGSPNEDNFGPGYKKLAIADPKSSITIKSQPENKLKSFFPNLTRQGFDLLSKLLCYNPDTRITAAQALNHPWFKEFPQPLPPRIGPDGVPLRSPPSPPQVNPPLVPYSSQRTNTSYNQDSRPTTSSHATQNTQNTQSAQSAQTSSKNSAPYEDYESFKLRTGGRHDSRNYQRTSSHSSQHSTQPHSSSPTPYYPTNQPFQPYGHYDHDRERQHSQPYHPSQQPQSHQRYNSQTQSYDHQHQSARGNRYPRNSSSRH